MVLMFFSRSVLGVGVILLYLRSGMGSSSMRVPEECYTRYTTVTGFFLQDEAETDAGSFDYTKTNLGLINRAYDTDEEYDPEGKKTQWQRFEHHLFRLNRESRQKLQYKVLIMGRHGEGYHNVAEAYYGTPAWDCYWSLQDGNGTITWSDAHLTPTGEAQALIAAAFWQQSLNPTTKIPLPESYYTSPLARCLATAHLTFSALVRPFAPTVKELFREEIGVHTCDRRSSKTAIREAFPGFLFEKGFTEVDELWGPELRESEGAQDARTKIVLDQVFESDEATFISVTSHSGEIGSILRVLGHRPFSLNTGAVIPVLVKAEVVKGPAPTSSVAPYVTVSTCATPPPTPTPGV